MNNDYVVGVSIKSFKFNDGEEWGVDFYSYDNVHPVKFKDRRKFAESFSQVAYSAGDNLFEVEVFVSCDILNDYDGLVFLDGIISNNLPVVDILVEYYHGVFEPTVLFKRKEEVLKGSIFSYEILSYNKDFLKVSISFVL